MPTTNIMTYEPPWLISADTNYQGFRYNSETHETIPTGKRVVRKWTALQGIFPDLVEAKSFLDIGCAQGFFLFKAIEHGAYYAHGVEKRPEYYDLLSDRLVGLPAWNWITLHYVSFPERTALMRADVVMCLSLVHHLFPTHTLDSILGHLAWVTDETLLVEWIAPEDKMVQRKGWVPEHPEYTEEAFLEAAEAYFGKVDFVNPGHHETRKIFRME